VQHLPERVSYGARGWICGRKFAGHGGQHADRFVTLTARRGHALGAAGVYPPLFLAELLGEREAKDQAEFSADAHGLRAAFRRTGCTDWLVGQVG
jgi:hypothetical protein